MLQMQKGIILDDEFSIPPISCILRFSRHFFSGRQVPHIARGVSHLAAGPVSCRNLEVEAGKIDLVHLGLAEIYNIDTLKPTGQLIVETNRNPFSWKKHHLVMLVFAFGGAHCLLSYANKTLAFAVSLRNMEPTYLCFDSQASGRMSGICTYTFAAPPPKKKKNSQPNVAYMSHKKTL